MHIWGSKTNKLGTFEEEVTIAQLALPFNNSIDTNNVTLTKISGSFPPGIRISGAVLTGTPLQVIRDEEFKFVLRATYNDEFQDSTFTMIVVGPDSPVWATQEGSLPVGNNDLTFILDNSVIDFQLSAIDDDLLAGDTLEYYIKSGNGEIPPGTQLTKDGRIVGIIDPLLVLDAQASSTTGYDTVPFGLQPFDYSQYSTSGFDSFFYDVGSYDDQSPDSAPKKLNRTYEFIVTVTDGDVEVDRVFKIFVVGDDFLRADNTLMTAGSGTFTADGSSFRNVIWLTPQNLGVRRANNYITLFLETLDPSEQVGVIAYSLSPLNPDNTKSELPPGLSLDGLTGEIAGRTPYQPAISKDYKFTVKASKYAGNADLQNVSLTIAENVLPQSVPSSGDIKIAVNKINDDDIESALIGTVWSFTNGIIQNNLTIIGVDTTTFENKDILSVAERIVVGSAEDPTGLSVPAIAAKSRYTKVIQVGSGVTTLSNSKTFTVKLLGESDSIISWNTISDLGVIRSNAISNLELSATSSVPNANVRYNLISGALPTGLSINSSGQIIGKAAQFSTGDQNGLIFFDSNTTTFDNGTTTYDRIYKFTVSARDQYGYDATVREFQIQVNDPSQALFSNLYFRPLLKKTQRSTLQNFLKNSSIFNPSYIYRLDDPNFGIVKDLKMLVYAGIETVAAEKYVAVTATNHKRKKLNIGGLRKAVAKNSNGDIIYEVIYLEIIDPNEPANGSTQKSFYIADNKKITVDMVKLEANDDESNEGEGVTQFIVDGRLVDQIYQIDDIVLEIFTRTGSLLVPIDEFLVDVRNDPVDVEIDLDYSSPEPNRFRPEGDTITVDSNFVDISRGNDQPRFISNIDNMRDEIQTVGITEREFLPLWMRTAQLSSLQELGYTKSVPLCYCKPGTGDLILNNITTSNFNFSQFDFDVDRYIIDSTTGNSNEQYIKFPDYRLNV